MLFNFAHGATRKNPGFFFLDPFNIKNAKEPATYKARRRLLEALCPAALVKRMYHDGYKPISASTTGEDFHVLVAKDPPSTKPGRKFLPLAGGLVDPATLARLSQEAWQVLQQKPALAQLRFWELGRRVWAECPTGNFLSFPYEYQQHVGDMLLMAVGVDPYVPRTYKQGRLVFPLEQVGNVCPADLRDYHLWLVASLREFDPRFRFVCVLNIKQVIFFHAYYIVFCVFIALVLRALQSRPII